MADDDEDDLFGDDASDDTNELLKNARLKSNAAPPKDHDDDEGGKGLFDSDSEDEDDDDLQQKKAKTFNKKQPAAPKQGAAAMSKRARLEALANKQRGQKEAEGQPAKKKDAKKSTSTSADSKNNDQKKESGYQSEDSYDSADFQRTQEDDDFLDTTGEDAEAVQELYAEQHFDDERPDKSSSSSSKKEKKRRYRDDEAEEDRGEDAEPDNPIMAAVHRMKKKKRVKKTLTEIEDDIKNFLGRMERVAEDDELAVSERRPATKKLAMLSEVLEKITQKDIQRPLLDLDLLSVCRRWIQPLRNGTLGNVTVRQRLLEAIGNMNEIGANDLKRSELGKVVMVLYKHHSETPAMKRQLKTLIEQWSRPIFQKSGNMRDLERVQALRGEGGLSALSRQHQQMTKTLERASAANSTTGQDLDSLIASGKKGGAESGINRVRVPFSKGFAFSVRPQGRADLANNNNNSSREKRGDRPPGQPAALAAATRDKLSKRMLEKGRAVSKNQRSANVSVEGRPTK